MAEGAATVVWVAALLLVASGAAKVVNPLPAGRALQLARLPGSRAVARALGLVEITVGLGALVTDATVARLALGSLYAAFAVFVGYLVIYRPTAPCGCLGSADARPNALHVVLNTLGAIASALATLGERMSRSPWIFMTAVPV